MHDISPEDIMALEHLLDWAHDQMLAKGMQPEGKDAPAEQPKEGQETAEPAAPEEDEEELELLESKPERSSMGKYEMGVGGEMPKMSPKMPVRKRY